MIDAENCNVTPDGRQALLTLSKGDMRRALNVLQACHAAYDKIDETAVYACVGNPHPKDIERILQSMMGQDFNTSFQGMNGNGKDGCVCVCVCVCFFFFFFFWEVVQKRNYFY